MPNPISIDEFVNRTTSTPTTSSGTASSSISINDFVNKSVATKPKQTAPKKDGLAIASDIVNAVFPMKNVGEAIGTEIAKASVPAEQRQYVAPSTATPAKIAGDLAQNALWFTPAGTIARGATAGVKALAPKLAPKAASTIGNVGTGAAIGYGADVGAGMSAGEENPLTPGLGTVIGAAIPGVASRLGPKSPAKVAAQREKTIGSILPGANPKQNQAASRAFEGVTAPKGTKSYSNLSEVLDKEVKSELQKVDEAFARNPTPQKTSALTRTIKSEEGKISRKVNYVNDAVAQLQKYYKATRDLQGEIEIREIIKKLKSVGLTPDEINRLARRHGTALNAFKKNGEPMVGLNKQAFENTRKGIKETARSFLPDEAARVADKKASDLIKTKEMIDQMAEKVYKLENRIKDPSILGNVGEAAGVGIDVATGGVLRAFLSTLLRNSNVRKRTLDSVDFQKQLEKNLKMLEKLENAPDGQIQSFLQRIQDQENPVLPGDRLLGEKGRAGLEDYISSLVKKPVPGS